MGEEINLIKTYFIFKELVIALFYCAISFTFSLMKFFCSAVYFTSLSKPFPILSISESILFIFLVTKFVSNSFKRFTHLSEILSNLRDVILPKLISGELRIPDAEKIIEEVGI